MYTMLAIVCGSLIAFMVYMNATLAQYTSSVWSSFIAHFVGTIVGGIFLFFIIRKKPRDTSKAAPAWWAYSAGIFGAFTVILANNAANSIIGISGAILMLLIGQIIFAWIVDSFGLFGMEKKKISISQYVEFLFVLAGSGCILFLGR